jgi:hypothetical protein
VDRTFLGQRADALTVDAKRLYWARFDDVRSAKVDGTDVDREFVTGLVAPYCARGCYGLDALAVDGAHIYGAAGLSNAIGRAKLNGTAVDQNFIPTRHPVSVVSDAGYIYWATLSPLGDTDAVGRANLDGTGIDEQLISGLEHIVDVAVDAHHIYWTSATGPGGLPTIGRANLDGTQIDADFITITTSVAVTSATLAIDEDHLYWANYVEGTIGRANRDGTGVDEQFISDLDYPTDIAVNALRPIGSASAKGTQKQKGHRIRVRVKVNAKHRMTARASGKIKINPTYQLKPKQVQVAAGKTKTLKLEPKRKTQAKKIGAALNQGKKATAKLNVRLTDQYGNSTTEKLKVTLKR